MKVFGSKELKEDVLDKGLCVGCGACVNLCPYLRNYKGRTAMLFDCQLPQGRCFTYCPKAEVDLDELASRLTGAPYEGRPLGSFREVVTSRAGERAPRGPVQAGGTVSALVALALDSGMIGAAVLTGRDGHWPVPKVVTRPDEVLTAAGSKYMAAPTLAALNQAVREGASRLGVVGTPCQITAVAKMRLNPLARDDFQDPVALTIGLFCTWALEARGLTAALAERVDLSAVTKMDIPPPPAQIFVIETSSGTVEVPLEVIRPHIPQGCQICPDMTAELADISVGVLEGRPGFNTLIVRSQAGQDLVNLARQKGLLEVGEIPPANLANLESGATGKKRRAFGQARSAGLLNNMDGQRSGLRVPTEVVARLLAGS